jgi:hypothetical protein
MGIGDSFVVFHAAVNGGEKVSQNGRFGNGSFSGKQPAGTTQAAFRMCLRRRALRKRNGKKE